MTKFTDGLYWVVYDDNDTEEMDEATLRRHLIDLPPVAPDAVTLGPRPLAISCSPFLFSYASPPLPSFLPPFLSLLSSFLTPPFSILPIPPSLSSIPLALSHHNNRIPPSYIPLIYTFPHTYIFPQNSLPLKSSLLSNLLPSSYLLPSLSLSV